ncbi:PilN domain-containing protein [Lysinibacillus parviboronicapiens]|uniref:PilN domain-containing protein n=1 Tax=Lysinibacillus parviboronicapiens TaxID=436516 RepID=UPI000D392A02|nr:PilN domain-containing protein [Lysinibacillus parviboronicapiens]
MVPNINLLPQLEKKTTSPKLLYGILIVAVGILIAYVFMMFFTAKSEIKALTNEEQALMEQSEQLQQELDMRQSVNEGSLEQSVQFVQSVSYPVTPLIDETRNLLPVHSYLRSYEFGADTINIIVDFESMTAISTYVERLLASNYFKDTQISSISNFNVELGEHIEQTPEQKFKEVPRYAVTITATIDYMYLAGGRRS